MRNRLIERVVRAIKIEPVCMAMPGTFLPDRIRRMLSGVPVPKISRSRMACTVAVCTAAAAILAVGTLVHAQSSKLTRPTFEVASVRPRNPNVGGGGGGKSKDGGGGLPPQLDHGRFNYSSTLFGLIVQAYGIRGCGRVGARADCPLISGAPDWITKSSFDIQAKMPDGSPEYTLLQFVLGEAPQVELMLQSLLEDRFSVKVHRETRQAQVYALTLVKRRPGLKDPSGEMLQLKDGTSVRNRSLLFTPMPLPNGDRSDHLIRLFVRDQSMQTLAQTLSSLMDHPVLDRTGLQGNFDFTMDYEKDVDVPNNSDVPYTSQIAGHSMMRAFQEELGLKLESIKAPVEVLVIDHVDKPSEN